MNPKPLMAAIAVSLVASTAPCPARADAAMEECLRNSTCSRMMQTMEDHEAKTGLALLFAHVNCASEIDLGIAASSTREMCRDLGEKLAAEKKVEKEKAAAAAAAATEAQRRREALPRHDPPGAISLCPPPGYRMTAAGCQPTGETR